MRFWDSSAIIPLLVEQPATQSMQALQRQDPAVMAWWATAVECASAIARLEREGIFSAGEAAEAFKRLTALRDGWREVPPSGVMRETAIRFLRQYRLRASDALQLAAAFLGAKGRPSTLEFVSLDERLCEAARREGFPLPLLPGS